MGSEMCIRDSLEDVAFDAFGSEKDGRVSVHMDGDKVAVALSQ